MGAKPGHEVKPETRERISKALKGRKISPTARRATTLSPEHRKAIGASLRKYSSDVCSIEGCTKRRHARGWCSMHYWRWKKHGDALYTPPARFGADTSAWKGEDVGYDAVHLRAQHLPRVCTACDATEGRLEIALLHGVPDEYLRKHPRLGIPYSVRPGDYTRLCVKCHRRYDGPKAETRREIEILLGQVSR